MQLSLAGSLNLLGSPLSSDEVKSSRNILQFRDFVMVQIGLDITSSILHNARLSLAPRKFLIQEINGLSSCGQLRRSPKQMLRAGQVGVRCRYDIYAVRYYSSSDFKPNIPELNGTIEENGENCNASSTFKSLGRAESDPSDCC